MPFFLKMFMGIGPVTPTQDEVHILNTPETHQNIFDSQYSLNTLNENFEIPTLNQTYSNTCAHSSQNTEHFNHTPCKSISPSSKFQKYKHYRKRTLAPLKLTALSKLRTKSQTPSIKTVSPFNLNHSVTNNNISSTENTLNTKPNSDSTTFGTIKTICHCDDPNFKLFREIQLYSHPILIKNQDKLLFFITPDLKICRFQ